MAGACRRQELVTLLTTCVEDFKTHFLIKLEDIKTKVDRSFIIVPGKLKNVNLLELVREYMALRPARTPHKRFFVNYIKLNGTVLDASLYTGHCIRRTLATLLANAEANVEGIKRHGGWRSSAMAEGYIDDCVNTKINVAKKILGEVPVEEPSTSKIYVGKENSGISEIAKKSNEILGMNISNNNHCVININHYNKQ